MNTYQIEVLLLDDEMEAGELSRMTLAHFIPEEKIHMASTVEEAVDLLNQYPIQLAFLDVELRSSDGFSLSQYIHTHYPQVVFVFLTGHVDLGAQSYDYEPFDFLVKPVDILRLERTLSRYIQRKEKQETSRVMVETSSGFVLLNVEEILYIAKNGNFCIIHCTDGQEHKVIYTMDKLEEMLEGKGFYRTYQSYLVPVSKIRQVSAVKFGTSYEAVLENGTKVPVSRNKYPRLKEYILQQSLHF